MQITITESTISDFPELINLYKQLWEKWELFDEEKLKEIYQTDITTSRRIYLIAKNENNIVGVCTLVIKDNLHYLKVAIVDELIVDANCRHQGIGKMLLDRAIDIAREKQCYRVELHSNIKRIETHRFYESNGFEKTSYYFTKKC
jgi:GNAT superfamily N-acetyltransferase